MRSSTWFKIAGICIMAAWLFPSCARLRNIPDGQAFLRKQDVVIHSDKPAKLPFDVSALPVAPMLDFKVPTDEILFHSRLKPNRRILWFRFNHTMYLFVNKRKLRESEIKTAERCLEKNRRRASKKKSEVECKSWRMFWAYTVGEPTALLDTSKMNKSAEQMNIFLQKKGYFRSRVEPEVVYNHDSSKCKVNFHVYPGKPYRIRSIDYKISDPGMASSIEQIRNLTSIDTTDIFDVKLLDNEREAIAT